MRVSTIRYTIEQGLRNIVKNKMFSIASIATMAACIFMFGIFYSLIINVQYIVEKAEEGVAIVVFVDEDVTEKQLKNIEKKLSAREEVLEVKYISAEEAWEEFGKNYFGEDSNWAEGWEENPLENSDNFEVYMKDISKQAELVEYAEELKGVRKVNKSEQVADALTNVNMLIAYVSGAIILVLLAVAIFLISNTVAMGITIRKEEIAIMKYIGAKDSFVRAPFIFEGVLIGIFGAAIPLVVLYFAYEKAINYILTKFSILNTLLEFLEVSTVYKTLLPVGLALGVGIGFVGSFFTIKKHLKA